VKLKQLQLATFRNYDTLDLDLHDNTIIFLGNNAQGKTSILESIYVLAFTKSHKTYKDTDIIQNGAEFAKINAVIDLKDGDKEMGIIISKLGKKAKYNRVELDRLSEYIGRLNVVMFAPEDLDLIKGNPKERRKFLDIEIGQVDKEYLYHLQQYKKVLKQRNDLLKTMQKHKDDNYLLLDVITDQLIDYQTPLIRMRKAFLKDVSQYAQRHYQALSGRDDDLAIAYAPSLTNNPKQEYTTKYQYDVITGTTNQGIHRDDIEFILNDQPLKTYGSQGEQRTAVLAVKLALIDFIKERRGEYPILLLDDVLSELDVSRQNNLLEYINDDIQTLITTTDITDINLDKLNHYRIYEVINGHAKESESHGA